MRCLECGLKAAGSHTRVGTQKSIMVEILQSNMRSMAMEILIAFVYLLAMIKCLHTFTYSMLITGLIVLSDVQL